MAHGRRELSVRWSRKALVVIAAGLVLGACTAIAVAPTPPRCSSPLPHGALVTVGPLQVWMPGSVTSPENPRAIALSRAIAAHLAEFGAWGYDAEPIVVELTDFASYPDHGHLQALGYYCCAGPHIACWVGLADEVPAMFHELCHATHAQRDVKHLDKRWPIWEAAGYAVSARLRTDRGHPDPPVHFK